MRGYSSIDNLSWEACQKLLRIEKSPERLQEIQDRLDELAKEIEGKDNSAYKACTNLTFFRFYLASYPQGLHVEEAKEKIRILEKEEENRVFKSAVTINDFNEYISKYPNGTYVREALIHVDDLFFSKNNSSKSKCKRYLAKYPNGRNVVEAKAIISRANKKRVFLVLLLIIAAIVVYLGFNPSGKIVFSELHGVGNSNNFSKGNVTILYYTPKTLTVPSIAIAKAGDSNKSLSFPKEGGSKEVVFTSGASKENIELTSSQSWISAKLSSDGKIIINVTKNEEGERTGNVEVKAYSTLFGIRTSSTTGVIYVRQATSYASHMTVSAEDESFTHKGGSRTITVTTDGFWKISKGTKEWGHISINGNTITLSIEENSSAATRTDYFVIKSGSKEQRINISQEGKPATRLSVSTENVSFSHSGGKREIRVYTDGEWKIGVGTLSWAHTSISDDTITIRVDENDSGYEQTDFFTVVAGDKEVRIDITQMGGPAAEVNKITVEHNVQRTGYNSFIGPFGPQQIPYSYNAMRISVNFKVHNLMDETIRVCAFFYDEDGDELTTSNNQYRAPDGQVTVQRSDVSIFEHTKWTDFDLEIPYGVMRKGDNKFQIEIQDSNGKTLTTSEYKYFSIN